MFSVAPSFNKGGATVGGNTNGFLGPSELYVGGNAAGGSPGSTVINAPPIVEQFSSSGGETSFAPQVWTGRGSVVPSPPVNAPFTYYVRKTGNNSNDGKSAGNAFLTIDKARSVVAAGDVVWVGAGTYREVVTLSASGNSMQPIVFNADLDGVQTGDAGEVIWTAFTTSDVVAAAVSALINVAGLAYYVFNGFTMVGGNTNPSLVNGLATPGSHDITFRHCSLFTGPDATSANGGHGLILVNSTTQPRLNYTFDSCVLFGYTDINSIRGFLDVVLVNLPAGSAPDYDCGNRYLNSLFIVFIFPGASVSRQAAIAHTLSGSADTTKGGGGFMDGCTIMTSDCGVIAGVNVSTILPLRVMNSAICTQSIGLNANGSGQIVESFNAIMSSTPRSNVTAGMGSRAAGRFGIEVLQSMFRGATIRPFATPTAGSSLLGLGAVFTQPNDLTGVPRTSGGSSPLMVAGALARSNTWGKETGTVYTGTNAISITGAGVQDFELPVDSVATTLTMWMRYDGTYAGAAPQLIVLNGTQAGVPTIAANHPGPVNTWVAVTIPISPTSQGIVTLRVASYDTSGAGHAYADSFSTS